MDMNANQSNDSNREAFEQSYRNFIGALEILAKGPEEQCAIMGFYNVAWELRDDILVGKFLLAISHRYLSTSQQSAIANLLAQVEALPETMFCEVTSEIENLNSMRVALWEPLRSKANELLMILQSATTKNEVYFETN